MAQIGFHDEAAVQTLDGGAARRVLSHTNDMMVVEIAFPEGGTGAVHTHSHFQSSYVKSGEFEYSVDGKSVIVREGDSLTFLPNQPHGCVCRKAGVLVDVFSPAREDFLK